MLDVSLYGGRAAKKRTINNDFFRPVALTGLLRRVMDGAD
jgi:hypothetical protein